MHEESVFFSPLCIAQCLGVLNVEIVAKLGVDDTDGIPDDTLRFV